MKKRKTIYISYDMETEIRKYCFFKKTNMSDTVEKALRKFFKVKDSKK